jgi:hypothetical protein
MSLAALVMLRVITNPKEGKPANLRCYECAHRRENTGTCHIACAKPDAAMTGSPHGIQNGWFMYPMNYDPVWATSPCANFEATAAVSPAVSEAVSRETA